MLPNEHILNNIDKNTIDIVFIYVDKNIQKSIKCTNSLLK